ncbi:hypothetical protein [Komagataeibacter medellinensis]|uniref:Uncharacterized protein n=1 Tax=Komagataeibacter medellinensis (strain NBRC 3288 / BCRC 11682 / LMG 1693 / Kondo 51) TaxID=634177 RepID=G2I8U7_KOMMN|nr:hypothetical protein [Komagataeibacter medellinensis]BAK85347.1 hypothetical protein GLX_31860 [Komagataeibacter medellinensis NBRC 3288]
MKDNSTIEDNRVVTEFLSNKLKEIDSELSRLKKERDVTYGMLRDLNFGLLKINNINPTEKRIDIKILRSYIIDYLKFRNGKPTKSCFIYDYLNSKYKNLNKSSFRTHLLKMKKEGLIYPTYKKGYWKI